MNVSKQNVKLKQKSMKTQLNEKTWDFIHCILNSLSELPVPDFSEDSDVDDGALYLFDATPQSLGYATVNDAPVRDIQAALKEAMETAGYNWWDDPDSPIDEPAVYAEDGTIWFDTAPLLAE